jgi:hypothetical protein
MDMPGRKWIMDAVFSDNPVEMIIKLNRSRI